MNPLKFSRKERNKGTVRNTLYERILRLHFLRAMEAVGIGAGAGIWVGIFLGWKAILLFVIAVPPALLCGNVWTEIWRKHPEYFEFEISFLRLLNFAKKEQPTLFWFGCVGTFAIGGLTYLAAGLPDKSSFFTWILRSEFLVEFASLYAIMIGVAGIPVAGFIHKRLQLEHFSKRVSAELAKKFLQEYGDRKN